MTSPSPIPIHNWTKDEKYLISTNPKLIPLDTINNDIFNAEDFTWGKPLAEPQLILLLERSLCFGIYEVGDSSQNKLIGFARFITDFVTVHYLTDVYILPAYRRKGLGIWLMSCVDEVFRSSSELRGMILIVDRASRNEEFYKRYLHMGELEGDAYCMDRKRSEA